MLNILLMFTILEIIEILTMDRLDKCIGKLCEGLRCQVLMPSKWIGAKTDEHCVYIDGVVKELCYTRKGELIGIQVNLETMEEYGNSSVENLMVLKSDFDEVYVDC